MSIQAEITPQDIFLKDLRTQTAESHKALEENEVSKALLKDDLLVKDYQTYLSKMYGLIKGIENDIYPVLGNIFSDLNERKKAHLIEADLISTGFTPKEISGIPVKKFSPANEAAALGSMYVLEGSSLGGRILYKHVNKYLGLTDNNGASFFNGYADRTGSMWKQFVQIFTDEAVKENNSKKVIDGAINTFNEVGEWMNA